MAPPSGVLDGTPQQFYLGQSIADPGVSRTSFGIPSGCAGPTDFVSCILVSNQLSNWQLESPIGKVIALLRFTGTFWNFFPVGGGSEIGNAGCFQYSLVYPTAYNLKCFAPFIDGVHDYWYVVPANTNSFLRQLSTAVDVLDGSNVWLRFVGL